MKKADQKIVKQLREAINEWKESVESNPYEQLIRRSKELNDPNNGMTDEERSEARRKWTEDANRLLEETK